MRQIIILDLQINLQTSTGTAKAVFWLVAPPNRVLPNLSFKSLVPTATTYATWASGQPYTNGAIVIPSPTNGFAYTCSGSGTSGGSQPTWPTSAGATVTENGGPTWTCNLVDLNSGITATELALLQQGLVVEVPWTSDPDSSIGALQTEIQTAYATEQTNLNGSAYSSNLYLESWNGSVWSSPL